MGQGDTGLVESKRGSHAHMVGPAPDESGAQEVCVDLLKRLLARQR